MILCDDCQTPVRSLLWFENKASLLTSSVLAPTLTLHFLFFFKKRTLVIHPHSLLVTRSSERLCTEIFSLIL